RGHVRQPLHRRRPRVRGRGDPPVAHPGAHHPRAARAQEQAQEPAPEEAREHPAMSEPEPYLKIVKGNVTPEEVAALVAAIAARTAPATQPVRKVDNWRNPAYRMRV